MSATLMVDDTTQTDTVLVVAPANTESALVPIEPQPARHRHKRKIPWYRRNILRTKPKNVNLLNEHEKRRLEKTFSRAKLLDRQVGCCGVGVGIDPIVGLIPFVGDFIGGFLSFLLVLSVANDKQVDVDKAVVARMFANVGFDILVGFVPVIGDYFDFVFACNLRNAQLLEKYLNDRAKKRTEMDPDQLGPNEEWVYSSGSSGEDTANPRV